MTLKITLSLPVEILAFLFLFLFNTSIFKAHLKPSTYPNVLCQAPPLEHLPFQGRQSLNVWILEVLRGQKDNSEVKLLSSLLSICTLIL